MNYTLKIYWHRAHGDDNIVEQATRFIPAEEIEVHGDISNLQQMDALEVSSYSDYRWCIHSVTTDEVAVEPSMMSGKLIRVLRPDGNSQWFIASNAWLLGPDGKTIERIAP